MMKHVRKYSISITVSILAIWIGYLCCVYFLSHVHVVDGMVYVHSHRAPIGQDASSAHHSHTLAQLFLLQQLSSPDCDQGEPIHANGMFFAVVADISRETDITFMSAPCWLVSDLRAPPCIVF